MDKVLRNLIYSLLLFFVFVSCAQNSSDSRSTRQLSDQPESRVIELLEEYFESQSIECEIESVRQVAIIRTPFSENDPHYVKMQAQCDSINRIAESVLLYTLDMDAWSEIADDESEIVLKMAQYKESWRGEPTGYAYECMVKSDDLALIREVESLWYIVSLDHSKLIRVSNEFLERYDGTLQD